jgi:GR25 family glycosyltransferase involved in LPS biosynthesis
MAFTKKKKTNLCFQQGMMDNNLVIHIIKKIIAANSDFLNLALSLIKINGLSKRTHGAGAFAYLINYKGAKAFVDCVQRHGMSQAVDWFIFEMADEIGIYKTYPHLVTTDAADTDIQL